jgi:hypothetical protein
VENKAWLNWKIADFNNVLNENPYLPQYWMRNLVVMYKSLSLFKSNISKLHIIETQTQ